MVEGVQANRLYADKMATTLRRFTLRRIGVADDPGHLRPSLQACLEAVMEQSDPLIESVVEGLLQSAIAPTQAKVSSATQTTPLAYAREAAEYLSQHIGTVRAEFSRHLHAAVFEGVLPHVDSDASPRFDDFQFLDASQIDASIELAQAQQAVVRAVEDVQPTLHALISALMGWSSMQAHLNPLRCETFAYALRETLASQLPPDPQRGQVLTMAAGRLGVNLRELYQEINVWLRSQGVEPVHVAQSVGGGLKGAVKTESGLAARTRLTLRTLRGLLSGELDPPQAQTAQPDFSHTVPASYEALEDMQLVDSMLRRLSDRARQAESGAAPRTVTRSADLPESPQEQRALGQLLGAEVVRLMLDNLVKDHRLLDPVRRVLQGLEPLLLTLTQGDPRFFSQRQHPARVFLDRITHRSLAFPTESTAGFAEFMATLDGAVAELGRGHGDAEAFDHLLRRLEAQWAAEDAAVRGRTDEATRSLLQAEQRNVLAQRLSAEFSQRMQGLDVPEWLQTFVRGPWSQVVAQARLMHKEGTPDPGGYKALVHDLLWSAQPNLTRRNRPRLVRMVPGMLVTLKQGLAQIDYPEDRVAQCFDLLIACHEAAFEGSRPAPLLAEGESLETPDFGDSIATDPWMMHAEAADSGYFDSVDEASADFVHSVLPPVESEPEWTIDELDTGAWVNLATGNEWVRAQLTWCSPQRTLFMFISGSGMAHSMSRRTLERFKADGLIQLISDGRVMDQALDAVAKAAMRNELLARFEPPRE